MEYITFLLGKVGEVANNIAAMVKRLIEADDAVLLDFSLFPDGNWPEAVTRA